MCEEVNRKVSRSTSTHGITREYFLVLWICGSRSNHDWPIRAGKPDPQIRPAPTNSTRLLLKTAGKPSTRLPW